MSVIPWSEVGIVVGYALTGAFANRFRGDSSYNVPQWLRRLSIAAMPVAVMVGLNADWFVCAAVLVLSYAGVIVGHGRYYTLGRGPYPARKDNWPGVLTSLVFKRRYTARFDAMALAITGLAFTGPLAAWFLLMGDMNAALALAFAGAVKPVIYELAWLSPFAKNHGDPIDEAEIVYGLYLGNSFGLTAIYGLQG